MEFFVVYIKEAHPEDDWKVKVNTAKQDYFKDPTSLDERTEIAETCVIDLKIDIPCLVDDMKNSTARAYKGWPDRLYLIGRDGNVAYRGGPGPRGFDPKALDEAIQRLPDSAVRGNATK